MILEQRECTLHNRLTLKLEKFKRVVTVYEGFGLSVSSDKCVVTKIRKQHEKSKM